MNPFVIEAKHHEPQERNATESRRCAERSDAPRRDRCNARKAPAPLLEPLQKRRDRTIGPARDLSVIPSFDLRYRFLPYPPSQELARERRFVGGNEMSC